MSSITNLSIDAEFSGFAQSLQLKPVLKRDPPAVSYTDNLATAQKVTVAKQLEVRFSIINC